MPTGVRIFVSHTTRDPRDAALARHIGDDLTARGAHVWIAPGSIPAGAQWRPEIVSAVMERCTHFLVILSAAAVGSVEVQKEIRLALERRAHDSSFVVLPLPVGRVDEFPDRAELTSYQQLSYTGDPGLQAAEVARALGLPPTTPHRFDAFIREKTSGFVGREHVFAAVERFLDSNDRGYLTIEGDPGIGKSAILAELVRRRGCLAHFNVRAEGVNTAADFLESMAAQLIARYSLEHPTMPPDATRNGAFLARLLEEAAGRLDASERILIAIDALDEVEQRIPSSVGANILFLPPLLPPRVYFILSRRQMAVPLLSSAPTQVVDLMQFQSENRADVATYLEAVVQRGRLHQRLDDARVSSADFIAAMTTKSDGNFMYLRYVIGDIERGLYGNLQIESLPAGLEAYYEDHWQRMGMGMRPLPRAKIKIVYVLAEVRQPVSGALLSRLSKEDPLTVQEALEEWDQFLREERDAGTTRYSIYHASFRDFLYRKDIVRAVGVTIEGINTMIADSVWQDLFDTPVPGESASLHDEQ